VEAEQSSGNLEHLLWRILKQAVKFCLADWHRFPLQTLLESSATMADEKKQMTQGYPLNSASQAGKILDAFQTGDAGVLRQQLGRFRKTTSIRNDTFEGERMELLSGIARELEQAPEPFCPAGAGVYKRLLEHLAAIRPVSITPMRAARALTAAASGFQSGRATMPV
jgi:hypothetical protein